MQADVIVLIVGRNPNCWRQTADASTVHHYHHLRQHLWI